MADTNTTNLNLVKPEVGASSDTWGTKINSDLDTIDGLFDAGPVLKVSKGGTGASTASGARTSLGLGGLAVLNAVGATEITDGSVGTAEIAADAVTTAKIGDGQVTTPKIGDGNVTTAKIADANVTTTKIGDGQVTAAKLAASVAALLTPTGSIMVFAGDAAPTGWALCHGQALDRVTYAALFAVVGTIYGAGDNSTTFNLPDLRGRVVAGQDDMGGTSANRLTNQTGGIDGDVLGATGGGETHTLTEAQMPSHSHLNGVGDTSTVAYIYGSTTTGAPGFGTGDIQTGSSTPSRQGFTSITGGGAAHNNVQPTIILNYIIKV